jgi:hypothetical protein
VYEQRFQDQFMDILRLFFNQIGNAMVAVLGPNGGVYIECPNGLFFDIESQTVDGVNTATPIKFRQSYLANAVSIVNNSKIRVATGGVYNFQFSGQLSSTNASSKQVYIWLKRDSDVIGYSTHAYTISGSGTQQEVSWNFNIDMLEGQTIELEWASDSTAVALAAAAATTPHPGIPSAVMAVNFIAPLPDTLPTPPTP